MDSGVTPTHSKKPAFVIIVLVLLLLGLVYVYGQNKRGITKSSLPPGWTEYKAQKYGFKFDYPQSWGTPQLHYYTQPEAKGYQIAFTNTKAKYYVMADIQSPGSSKAAILTKSGIQKALAGSKKSYIKYDSSSYATLLVDPKTNAPGQLNIFQIVSLPKLNASAVATEVIIKPQKGCPTTKLADNSSTGCVTTSIYNDLSQFSKSISPLETS